jgi:hypothetical protein
MRVVDHQFHFHSDNNKQHPRKGESRLLLLLLYHPPPTMVLMSSQTPQKPESASSLPAPAFQLPSDFEENPSRYELWTLRLPTEVKLEDLDGCRLPVGEAEAGTVSFESNEKQYQMLWGDPVENGSFRLLVAQTKEAAAAESKDDSEDSDDSEKEPDRAGTQLYPSMQPFARHLNIIESLTSLEERQLAPTREEAPPAAAKGLRRAYVPVPPRMNLQRRWNMPGAVTKSQEVPETITPPPLRKLSEVDSVSAVAVAVPAPAAVVARASPPTEEDTGTVDAKDDIKPQAKRKSSETSPTEETTHSGGEHSIDSKEAKRAKKEAKKEKKEAKKEKKKARKAEKKTKKER